MSVTRFSRIIQSLRAAAISDAESSPISARSAYKPHQVLRKLASRVVMGTRLGVGEPTVAIQELLLAAQQPGLQADKHALQGQVGRRGLELGGRGRGVWLNVSHATADELLHDRGAARKCVRLLLRAAALGQQPLIRGEHIIGHQPVEQAANAVAFPGRYQRRSALCGA
jgi:hypothetical protein